MRRILLTTIWGVFLQLLLPSPALAWWELLEELSGPGKFYGWDIQARVLCVADTRVTRADGTQEVTTEKFVPSAIGVVVSACNLKPGSTRRLAVDIGARFLWADDNTRFANGQRVSLTTLEPAVSINLLSKYPDRDFVDYAFGAGVYWFSSTEFPSFNGAFLEPVRFEFHPTTNMKKNHKWAAAIPAVRVGYLVFPGGFETASFAASPDVPARISRDWVYNVGIFFDLEGLFR